MAGTCSYSAGVDDYDAWGGDPDDWTTLLRKTDAEGRRWECPHEALDGREHCPFHTDPGSLPEGVDQREELLAAVEASTEDPPGTHRYRRFIGASFGSLDLDDGDLVVEDEHAVLLLGAHFEGELTLDGTCSAPIYAPFATFERGVDCTHVTFENRVHFGRTTFGGETDFEGATFEDRVEFKRATFTEQALLWVTRFEDRADFRKTRFEGEVHFEQRTIEGTADFRGAQFESEAHFGTRRFGGEAKFEGATFGGGVDFEGASFSEAADFERAAFHDTAAFGSSDRRTVFEGPATFAGARFEGTADFSGTPTDEVTHATVDGLYGPSADAVDDGVVRTAFTEPPDFSGAEMAAADLVHADLAGADFTDANLTGVNLTDAVLHWCGFERARLNRATLFGADLRGARLSGVLLGDARIDEATHFLGSPADGERSGYTFDAVLTTPCCVYDRDFWTVDRLPRPFRWLRFGVEGDGRSGATRPEGNQAQAADDSSSPVDGLPSGVTPPEPDLDRAKSVYRTVEDLARANARPQLQGQAFVRRQEIQRTQYAEVARAPDSSGEERVVARLRQARATVSKLVLLYGESPWRVVGWALLVVGLFAGLYPLGGWMVPVGPGGVQGDPITLGRILGAGVPEGLALAWQSVYYSTLTFTALGFGDFRPRGFGQVLTSVETALGTVLIALLVFVLGRRAAR